MIDIFYYHLTESWVIPVEASSHRMLFNQLLNNARLTDGYVYSTSSCTDLPDGAGTAYNLLNDHKMKEQVWDEIRMREFPSLPSRRNGLFLFDDINSACKANQKWFANARDLVRVRIVEGSVVHKADSRWLDTYEIDWEQAARNYWKGTPTEDPFSEIIVHGTVHIDIRKNKEGIQGIGEAFI